MLELYFHLNLNMTFSCRNVTDKALKRLTVEIGHRIINLQQLSLGTKVAEENEAL